MKPGDNYFATQDELLARLQELLPELKAQTLEEIRAAERSKNLNDKVLYVVYDGDTVRSGDNVQRQTRGQFVTQRWFVLLGIRDAKQQEAPSHNTAGPLLSKIISALNGWQPSTARIPMRRITGPSVDYGTNFTLYPLAFELELITH
jgi:hypothetical protein